MPHRAEGKQRAERARENEGRGQRAGEGRANWTLYNTAHSLKQETLVACIAD